MAELPKEETFGELGFFYTVRKSFKFISIRTRLTLWLLIIAIFSMIIVNIGIYKYVVNSLSISIYNKLESIRDLKVREVNHWLDERIIDIRTISNEIRVLENIHGNSKENNKHNISIISEVRELFKGHLKNYDEIYEIFIVSPYTRKNLVSTDRNNEGKELSNDSHFEEALQSLNLLIGDIHYSATMNKPCMALSIPIFSSIDSNHINGILVARINPEASLYNLLLNRTGMGKTGETLIVNKDIIALNELRWHKNSALKLKLQSKPATEASRGRTGIIETADYRGERVLAAYTHIPKTGWGFIAKQDLKEVYSPIYQMRNWMLAIGILTLFGVVIVAFYVSKSISNPIKELHKGSEIIGSGNLDHKVGTDAKDEIGELSRTFDRMIVSLKTITASRDDLNEEITERKRLEKMLLEFREHERRRIGHELHDNLGQQLTAISFMAQGLENVLRKKSIPNVEDAARITNLIEKSKKQVKYLSLALAPLLEKGEYGLITAMVELAFNSEKLFGIPCVVRCDKPVPIYNDSSLIHLYRIAQEAITNAARHAKPSQIEIHLNREHDKITLTIKDNGTGFAVPRHVNSMGLEIMRYRASMINASIDIRPGTDKGTVVTCVCSDVRKSEINIT